MAVRTLLVALVLALGGCLGSEGGTSAGLGADEFVEPGDGEGLECAEDGSTVVTVAFECECITTESCKDLSNVVIEYADGTHERFEGLDGHVDTFCGDGRPITGAWIKSGANSSGDGPGYGEFFEAPVDTCDGEEAPPAPPEEETPPPPPEEPPPSEEEPPPPPDVDLI
jgi:hypothetical protein